MIETTTFTTRSRERKTDEVESFARPAPEITDASPRERPVRDAACMGWGIDDALFGDDDE